ncbi:J domain-containing protein [bacterium]|nr:J domain-containing protein [bacterium]
MPSDPPELPDDPTDWPADPFALLGVRPGASEQDVKRAYTRLIRRFKPEHAPEQFRRIREAYEACLQDFRWLAPPADAFWETAPPPPPPEREPPPRGDEIDRLWELAVAGDEAAAYAGLAERAGARPDVRLRLYWLLGLNPALDPDRSRHHWLAAALREGGLGGAAAELYRRELDADPNAALYGPYADLLEAPAAPRDRLAVARWRVAAAGRSESWVVAAADLRALARSLPHESEPAWLDLLAAAHGWAVWVRAPKWYDFCRAELDKLRHLELRHAHYFDRVDEGEYLAAAWRAYQQMLGSPGLFALVPHAWVGDTHPGPFGRVAGEVAANPGAALAALDRCPPEVRPVFVVLLVRALEDYRAVHPPAGPEPDMDLVRGLAAGFPAGWRRDYPGLRAELLAFLLAEAVDPAVFAEGAGRPAARRGSRPRTDGRAVVTGLPKWVVICHGMHEGRKPFGPIARMSAWRSSQVYATRRRPATTPRRTPARSPGSPPAAPASRSPRRVRTGGDCGRASGRRPRRVADGEQHPHPSGESRAFTYVNHDVRSTRPSRISDGRRREPRRDVSGGPRRRWVSARARVPRNDASSSAEWMDCFRSGRVQGWRQPTAVGIGRTTRAANRFGTP